MCAASWKFWNSTGVKDVPAAKAHGGQRGFLLGWSLDEVLKLFGFIS